MKMNAFVGILIMTAVAGQAVGQAEPKFWSFFEPREDAASNSRIIDVRINIGVAATPEAGAILIADQLEVLTDSNPVIMIQNFASASGFETSADHHMNTSVSGNTRGYSLWYNHGIAAAETYIGDMHDKFNLLQAAGQVGDIPSPTVVILDEEQPIAAEYWDWNCVVGIAELDDDIEMYKNTHLTKDFTVYGFANKTSAADIVRDEPDLYVDVLQINWDSAPMSKPPSGFPDGLDGELPPSIINVANWLLLNYGTNPSSPPLYIDHARKYLGVAWSRVSQQVRAASIEKGLIEPLRDGKVSGATGDYDWTTELKWSNYDSSISLDNEGDSGVERYFKSRSYEATRDASKFDWHGAGSFDSPVLYPVSNCYVQTGEDRMDATLRIHRDNLNAIAESDTSPGDRGIVPWLLTADLDRSDGDYNIVDNSTKCNGNGVQVASKAFFRDMVAMCRAKGVTEYILWGQRHGPASVSGDDLTERYDAWDATSQAIDQVWDYQLDEVSVIEGNETTSSSDTTDLAQQSDQDPIELKIDASVITVQAEFSMAGGAPAPTHLALIVEVNEDSGLSNRSLEIKNHCSGLWETASATLTEINQGRWEQHHNYKILRWKIDITGTVALNCPLNMFSLYIAPSDGIIDGSIDVRLTYSGAVGKVAKIDLMQLYAIDTPPAPATFEEGLEKILTAFEGDTVPAGEDGDYNNDGVINKVDDLIALIEQEKANR